MASFVHLVTNMLLHQLTSLCGLQSSDNDDMLHRLKLMRNQLCIMRDEQVCTHTLYHFFGMCSTSLHMLL